MPRRIRVTAILIIVIKAIIITATILFFGRFFGLNVREAGGDVTDARIIQRLRNVTLNDIQPA